jgi:hypothetical protein
VRLTIWPLYPAAAIVAAGWAPNAIGAHVWWVLSMVWLFGLVYESFHQSRPAVHVHRMELDRDEGGGPGLTLVKGPEEEV